MQRERVAVAAPAVAPDLAGALPERALRGNQMDLVAADDVLAGGLLVGEAGVSEREAAVVELEAERAPVRPVVL